MSRAALSFVLLVFAQVASAADLPPGAVARLGDDRARAGGAVHHLALSPDGKQFATTHSSGSATYILTVWDSATGRLVRNHEVNDELFGGFVWGPGGGFAVLTRGEPETKDNAAKLIPYDFRVWSFGDPKAKAPALLPATRVGLSGLQGVEAERPRGGARYAEFLLGADGTRVAARRRSADGGHAVHVFEMKPADGAARLVRAGAIDLGAEGADDIHLSADGKSVVVFRTLANEGASECTATVWDVTTGKPAKPVRVPLATRFMVTPDARSLAVFVTEDREWGFDHYDLRTAKRRKLIRWEYGAPDFGPPTEPRGFAFAPAGRLVVAVAGKTYVIDLTTGKELGRLEGHAREPSAVAVSADGTRIATADEYGLVRLWDAKTFRPLDDAPGHRAPVEHAELSPDGKRLLTWAPDETVRLWDVATGKELRAFAGATDDSRPVFASGGTAVVYRNKNALIARDLQTGLEVPLPDDAKALEPRAAILATARLSAPVFHKTSNINLHETASGELRRTLSGHRGAVRVLGFTPDGTKLLTAGGDHTVLVWDMRLQEMPLPDAIKKETNAAKLWDTLASGKAEAAYLAMARLSREPDAALKLARMKLKPAAKGDRESDATNVTDARAVELLEALDTADARALLKELAGGHADAFRTQEAKRALERAEKR